MNKEICSTCYLIILADECKQKQALACQGPDPKPLGLSTDFLEPLNQSYLIGNRENKTISLWKDAWMGSCSYYCNAT